MKQTLCAIAMMFCLAEYHAQIPNVNEWARQKRTQRKYLVQQIAALKVYGKFLKKGYEVAQKGLFMIHDIKNGTHSIDGEYFSSLRVVKRFVIQSPEAKAIVMGQQSIVMDFGSFVKQCREDQYLTEDEVQYITQVYEGLLTCGQTSLEELARLTTDGEMEMRDSERLDRLAKIHSEVYEQHAFSQSFIATTQQLSRQRAQTNFEVAGARRYYDVQP